MKTQMHLARAALVLAGATFFALSRMAPAEEPTSTNAPGQKIVYYFHRTLRCPTCLSMETWTSQTVAKANSGESAAAIEWQVVNLDEPANAHFADDFHLTFGTVVVAENREGKAVRWKNLEKVWEFSADEATYGQYLDSEFAPFFGLWQ